MISRDVGHSEDWSIVVVFAGNYLGWNRKRSNSNMQELIAERRNKCHRTDRFVDIYEVVRC